MEDSIERSTTVVLHHTSVQLVRSMLTLSVPRLVSLRLAVIGDTAYPVP